MQYISASLLRKIYKPRPDWARKGMFGKLLVIGGSRVYSGSPTFNAYAAYRAGCDLVTVAAPRRAADIVAQFLPEMITVPLEGDFLAKRHLKEIFALIDSHDAAVIGGGLGRNTETMHAVREALAYIKKSGKPCVVDADALHALKNERMKLDRNFVLTPHAREFLAITGKKLEDDAKQRAVEAKRAAARLHCIVLVKGHIDVISDGSRVALDREGTSYMTKGGAGDVLAGICGSLLSRGASSYDAACAAAFITGSAGAAAAKKYGESMLASDVCSEIGNVIKGVNSAR